MPRPAGEQAEAGQVGSYRRVRQPP